MEYPNYLNNLIEALKMFPGVGAKSATRMAIQMIDMDEKRIQQMGQAIMDLSSHIQFCQTCYNISDGPSCSICSDSTRNHNLICVVSNFKDIYAIEKMNAYEGVYHVLNGDIAINKGITPDKLTIPKLISRLNPQIQEIIIATNPTIEGETTAIYLGKVLADYNVKTTRIGHGMPIGANIDYIDELTMLKAFQNRQDLQND